MSTARDEVVAALETIVPTSIRVVGYARAIDPPQKPTVLVKIVRVTPAAIQNRRAYEFGLVIIPTKTDPNGPADDELDAALETVLDALDQWEDVTWSAAERGTYQDTTYPAYEVAVTLPIVKTVTTP